MRLNTDFLPTKVSAIFDTISYQSKKLNESKYSFDISIMEQINKKDELSCVNLHIQLGNGKQYIIKYCEGSEYIAFAQSTSVDESEEFFVFNQEISKPAKFYLEEAEYYTIANSICEIIFKEADRLEDEMYHEDIKIENDSLFIARRYEESFDGLTD